MKVYDIEGPIENRARRSRFESGASSQLRDQRRQEAEGAFEPVHHDAFVVVLARRRLRSLQPISIEAMHDLDVMTMSNEGARQPTDIGPATSEVVGRIKSGDHAEPHQPARAKL